MRDLYQRLHLPRHATAADIDNAIRECPHYGLREDARAVLAHDAARQEYDALHDLLSDVGQLRAGLGMTHAPHWRGSVALDFTPPPDERRARHESLNERLDAALHPRRRFALPRLGRRRPARR